MSLHPHQVTKGVLMTSDQTYARFMAAVSGTIVETFHKSDTVVGAGSSAAFDLLINGVSIYGSKPTIGAGQDEVSQAENQAVTEGDIIEFAVDLTGALASVGGKMFSQCVIEDGLPTHLGGTSTTSLAITIASKTLTTQEFLGYSVGSRIRLTSDADPTTHWMEGVVTAYSGTSMTVSVDLILGSGSRADWNLSLTGERGATGATGATGAQGDPGVVEAVVAGDNIDVDDTDPANPIVHGITMVPIGVACSDESTAITTGTQKVTFRMPYDFDVYEVRANLKTASSSGGPFQVDINQNGTSIFGTDKLTIDDTEKTSLTAATPVDLTAPFALDDDDEMTVDVDDHGTGAIGLKIWLIGRRRF